MPELDPFTAEVLDFFCGMAQTQFDWSAGMGYARRVGIPAERLRAEAALRRYFPEEHFLDKFRICERAIINYDISKMPKG
jgi:hypothetical protein